MQHQDSPSLEELLGHQDWIRNLARGLVRSGESADDLVQETWMSALERPPRDDRDLQSWLAAVLRNSLSEKRRSARRRRRREAAVAAVPNVMSPEEVLEREDLRRKMVRELMALSPEIRDVMLLKFCAELPPRKVAAS